MRTLAAAVLMSFAAAASAQPLDRDRLEAFVDGVVTTAMQDHRIPGVVVSVVHGGEVVLEKGYGYAREPDGVTADAATSLFRVASISKTFNATALMQLVERDLVDLDAPFTRYLPDIAFRLPFGEPTVRDLLTHSAGFEDSYFGHFWAIDEASDHALEPYIARYQPTQVRAPGERVVYSNYGTAVVGLIVQRLSGMDYADYLDEHVLRPLGMTRSTFRDWPGEGRDGYLPAELEPDLAHSYVWTGGRFRAPDRAWMHRGMNPAGGLVSTAREMTLWMRAHLGDGSPVLSPDAHARLHTPTIANHPGVARNAHGFWVNDAWGYETREHGGSIFGFMSAMVLVPELDLGIFVSTNAPPGLRLTQALPPRVVGQFFPRRVEIPSPGDADALKEYAGQYRAQRRGYTTVDKLNAATNPLRVGYNDQGYLTLTGGQTTTRFVPLGDDRFISPDTGERIAFSRDDRGRPVMVHGSYGHNNFERFGFLASANAVVLTAGVLVATFVAWLLTLALTRHLRRPETRAERIACLLGAATMAAWVVGGFAYYRDMKGVFSLTAPHFAHFPTAAGWWWVVAGPVAAALTAVLAVYLVAAWRAGTGHASRRILLTMFAMMSVVLVAYLEYWNALGLRTL